MGPRMVNLDQAAGARPERDLLSFHDGSCQAHDFLYEELISCYIDLDSCT